MKFKDLLDDEELYIKMISEVLGITREEVLSADTTEIIEIGDYVYSFINKESKKLFKQIEFKETKYNLVDVNNISFGQYADIDTFLRKDEGYRIANLNELAAYLYTEDGIVYTNSNIKLRIEEFKTLPIKYVEGAIFFFVEFSKSISRTYPSLFPEQAHVDGNEDKNNFNAYWGWYSAISTLANDSVFEIDNVVALPLYQCLNHLSYIIDKRQEQERLNKMQSK